MLNPIGEARLVVRVLVILAAAFVLVPAVQAQLVINEIMNNPSAVFDSNGEWFEIFNPTGSAIDINGWTIRDLGIDSHLIVNGGPLLVPAGGFVVLGNNADSATNGGVTVDYSYGSSWFLSNSDDEVILLDVGLTEIDRVEYDGGPEFPDPNGASMSLIDPALDNNVGANWCEASTPFGDGDLGTPGGANDCVAVPVVVINEIMNNPSAVFDSDGEWFEVFNPSGAALDIDGWTLRDEGTNIHVISNGGPLVVPAGGYVVLGNNADMATNGGVMVAYEYSDFFLSNGDDEIILLDGSLNEVDRVEYDGGPEFPDPNGASMSLIDPALDNNVGANWCEASTPFGDGDLGTPGGANDCPVATPELVINEIMNNPSAVFDSDGEWFEVFNPTGAAIDIDGWTIEDNGSDSHVINNGGPLMVPAGGYAVLGNNADMTTNGGVMVAYEYSGFFLSNGDDEVVLLDSSLSEVDRVEYDGGPVFPDPTGASMALIDPGLDNNDGTNWCTSTTPFGDGDLGTPGGANDCLTPFVAILINEIHADPESDIRGDANRDGVRDFSDDEFVEIFNFTGGPLDISGWTLADGVRVRHIFPPDTVLLDQCGIVVFGGGEPNGSFGGMLDQVASDGALGLNNNGDTVKINNGVYDVVTVSYGREGGDDQSLTRDPDITGLPWTKHSEATNSGGTLFSPGTMVDGLPFDGCGFGIPTLEIFDIQGDDLASPYTGSVVTTNANVVTALSTDGFFMQTPTARTDGDVDTSDGIFVFEDGAPSVSVGDQVNVTGRVAEFFGFTEFSAGSTVTMAPKFGGSVPAPVIFDETVPSPDPTAPSCAIEFECYESMLVDIAAGAVTGPNQRFGSDPIAEVYITAAAERTFREPGIEFPGQAGYPVWDGNPEVFELDPDRLGLPNQIIPAGSAFSAVGVVGYEFGGYELWPTALTVDERSIPIPVRERADDEFTVGSLNMFRFFDDIDDPPSTAADGRERDDFVVSTEEYERRRDKFVQHILEVLDAPDILAVQEAEKLEILEALAVAITAVDPSVVYTSYLIEGNDVGTIDIGFMVRESITVDGVLQLGKEEYFTNPDTGDLEILHDRPPLLLQGRHLDQTLVQVFNVHMRSLNDIEEARTQQKRYDQANSVAEKVQMIQDVDAEAPIIVIGDFNAFQFSDSYVDLVGQILGDYLPAENVVCETNTCDDLVEPNLANQIATLPMDEMYSFIFRGNAQALDHALTGVGMEPFLRGFGYGRGNADAAVDWINDAGTALRASDHDGLVLYVLADGDLDGVPDHLDVCPGTEIPEGVPTVRLGTNRWALVDNDFFFDTKAPGSRNLTGLSDISRRPMEVFSTTDTAGCSCEQIIVEMGLGQGHVKFGCSTGVMRTWIRMVSP